MSKYTDAIEWIAQNDDTEWLTNEYGSPSVTLHLVAELFGKDIEKATKDLRKKVDEIWNSQGSACAPNAVSNPPKPT